MNRKKSLSGTASRLISQARWGFQVAPLALSAALALQLIAPGLQMQMLAPGLQMVAPAYAQFNNRYKNLPPAGFGNRPQVPQANAPQLQGATMGGRAKPQNFGSRGTRAQSGPAGVYPEFRSPHGVIRWIPDQMPLKVWVSDGRAIDALMNPQLGAPYANVDMVGTWPDLAAQLFKEGKANALPVAEGFRPEHKQATIDGINFWKPFEKEKLFTYELTDDPMEASIHVFYVHHFVNKLGLALFANDIRGYTSKRSFSYKAIMQGKNADFKPVVIVLRTTDKYGRPMDAASMKAAAGHEFGHALGIEDHSKNPADLMSVYYGKGRLSNNDAATIRYLYKLTPDLIP